MNYRPIDVDAIRRDLGDRCFICEMLSGNPEFAHDVFYEDAVAVAFLNRYPRLLSYALVAPKAHREQVTGDFPKSEYLALQDVVFRVSEAIRQTVPTERLYILSLGSQQANSHVHWHVAPLPPGVPFDEQQFAALDRNECIDVPADEMAALAAELRTAIARNSTAR